MKSKAPSVEVYVSVDIEASGPIPGQYSMLAIGACIVGAADSTFYAELKPISENANAAAMKIVGRPLAEFQAMGADPRDVMLRLRAWVDQATLGAIPVFVGFNATFDWAFVNWYFMTYLGENPFGVGGLDIKSYYMGLSGVKWAETRSSRIPLDLSGAQSHSHNALNDAREQGAMFERMLLRRSPKH